MVRLFVPGIVCAWGLRVAPAQRLAAAGAGCMAAAGLLSLAGGSVAWMAVPLTFMVLLMLSLVGRDSSGPAAVLALLGLQLCFGFGELWMAGSGIVEGYHTVVKQIGDSLEEGFRAYVASSGEQVSPAMEAAWQEVKASFIRLFPSLMGTFYLMAGVLNVMAARRVARGAIFGPEFSRWNFPDHLVWLLIAAGATALFGDGAWETAGVNALMVVGAVFAVQGLAIAHYHFERNGISLWFRAAFYLLITFYRYGLLSIALLGLGEVWWRLRPPEGGDEAAPE